MAGDEHMRTIITEGRRGFSVICACGWRGQGIFAEEMSAAMAHGMHVAESTKDEDRP